MPELTGPSSQVLCPSPGVRSWVGRLQVPGHSPVRVDWRFAFARVPASLEDRHCLRNGRPGIHPEVMLRRWPQALQGTVSLSGCSALMVALNLAPICSGSPLPSFLSTRPSAASTKRRHVSLTRCYRMTLLAGGRNRADEWRLDSVRRQTIAEGPWLPRTSWGGPGLA